MVDHQHLCLQGLSGIMRRAAPPNVSTEAVDRLDEDRSVICIKETGLWMEDAVQFGDVAFMDRFKKNRFEWRCSGRSLIYLC